MRRTHSENIGASPLIFLPVVHLRVYLEVAHETCCHLSLVSSVRNFFFFFLFPIWVFFHNHLRITELQGKVEGISLTPHYHFTSLHRHLDISQAIIAVSLSLHMASSRTRTRNLWFLNATYTPSEFLQSNEKRNSRRIFWKKFVSIVLPPSHIFYSGKWKITPLSPKTLKGYLENLKISIIPDLLFRKSIIFQKSNLHEK